jgi:hypothetical protein
MAQAVPRRHASHQSKSIIRNAGRSPQNVDVLASRVGLAEISKRGTPPHFVRKGASCIAANFSFAFDFPYILTRKARQRVCIQAHKNTNSTAGFWLQLIVREFIDH